jgi:hypothetical protein
LLQCFFDFDRHGAHDGIGSASSGQWDNDFDRPIGEVALGHRRQAQAQRSCGSSTKKVATEFLVESHVASLGWLW